MKQWIKRILIAFISFVVLIFVIVYLIKYTNAVEALSKIQFYQGMILVVLSFLSVFVSGKMTKLMAEFLGVRLTTTEWLGMANFSTLLNTVIPLKFGSLFSAAYYKKVCGLQYSKFVAMFSGEVIINLSAIMTQLLLSLMVYSINSQRHQKISGWVYGLVVTCFVVGILGILFAKKHQNSIVNKMTCKWNIQLMVKSFLEILTNRKLFIQLLLFCLAANGIQLFRMIACYKFMGISVNFLSAAIYTSLNSVIGYISVLPGNIGVNEVLMGVANNLIGNDFSSGVIVSVLLRGVGFIAIFIGSIAFSVPLFRNYYHQGGVKCFPKTPKN